MNIKKIYNNNKGFALVLSLLIMAAMTAIGLAAVTTATTDMMIAKNEYEAKKAFYLAEAGLVEALVRMDQPQVLDDGFTVNPRFIGETTDQRNDRIDNFVDYVAATPTADHGTVLVSDLTNPNIGAIIYGSQTDFGNGADGSADIDVFVDDIGGNYEVVVEYATEADDQFTYAGRDIIDAGIVLYCAPYFSNVDYLHNVCDKAVAVFKITSTGKTESNTSVQIVNFVTSSTLNIMPPSGELYAQTEINMGGSSDIFAYISSNSYSASTDCETPDCVPEDYVDTNMCTHLGIDIKDIGNMADSPSVYTQTGGSASNYSASDVTAHDSDDIDWGDYCADDNSGDPASTDKNDHICNNEAKIILIENSDVDYSDSATCASGTSHIGAAKLNGGYGRGILIVTGDLEIGGGFFWEGLIYVMGDLKLSGTSNIYGDLMVKGTASGTGDLTLDGDDDIAMSVAVGIGTPMPLRWLRANL